MYLNMLWEWIAENSKWFFSGAGNIFLEKIFNNFEKDSQLIYGNDTQENNIVSETVQKEDSYAELLGKRHKHLRENYLELNPRKMADFYGYEKVAELETYEDGKDEFPLESIAKLEQTFFINSKYLEEGDPVIFQPFRLCHDEVRKLLQEGFSPCFLCYNTEPYHLYTYPVFYKQEENYSRTVVANLLSDFNSGGGGRKNIEIIRTEMVKQGMEYLDASIVKVNESTWKALDKGRFYSKYMYFGLGIDEDCCDIFEEWYRQEEYKFLGLDSPIISDRIINKFYKQK